MTKVVVNGAVVGKNMITLFLADGEPKQLPQDSWRTQEIMEKVAPALATQAAIEIDLEEFSLAAKIEQMTSVKATEDEKGEVTLHQGGVAIPAATLDMHIERAAVDGAKGLKHFMQKFEVIKRAYTKQELLKFLKDADLPFMDDGSILGFKILGGIENDYMVDHHSRRVRQRLGSLVFMPESKVDQSRSLCSTGLHIAARAYLRGFWRTNSKLCLVKIQPKDVVSVPEYEHSKMRVSAYHIVKVFSDADAAKIVTGTPIHDLPDALRMLEEAVAGNHTPIVETVEVRGYGEITVTPVASKVERVVRKKQSKVSARGKVKLVSPAQINALKKLAALGRNVAKWSPTYTKKMVEAQVWFDKGKSLRWIAEKLGIDRDSMTANLDRRPRRKKVA